MTRSTIVSGVLGLALLAASAIGLASTQQGSPVRSAEVAGAPVTLYPADATSAPTVIVAHGFAASSAMMAPLARGLNRAGFTVVTFDFPGHGANPRPLVAGDDARAPDSTALTSTLAQVRDWAAAQPEVDGTRMALLGHSMGAIAVTELARTDAGIPATVSLSLPSAANLPSRADLPRNLLLLHGALEPGAFVEASTDALRAAYPQAQAGTTFGDMAQGTARRAQAIPGVEHITILFSDETLQESTAWLGRALGLEPRPTSMPPVLLLAVLALVAGGLLLVPVARGILGRPRDVVVHMVGGRRVVLVSLVAAIAGALIAWATTPLQARMPLAVGGYLAAWFAGAGIATLLLWLAMSRRQRSWPPVTTRALVGAAAVTAVALAVIVIPGRITWASFSFTGPRWWIALVMLAAFTVFFTADELLLRRASTARRLGLAVASRLIAVVAILAAIPLLQAPGFLILVMPVLLLFLLVLAVYAAIASSCRHGFVAAVAVQAVPAAVLVATVFPLLH